MAILSFGRSLLRPSTASFRGIRCLASGAYQQNLIERIAQKYAVGLPDGHVVKQGDFVSISPEHVMTHDNTAAVMSKFTSIGASRFKTPAQPVFTLDHDVQNKTEKNLTKYASIRTFAEQHGIDHYPAGRGIGHQIMVEEGYTFPLSMTVASDSHSNMYGGVGALGTPIVRTDAAAIWATGRTWWQVPPVVKVELTGGPLRKGVTGKDVIVTLCAVFNKDEVLNHAIEFTGEGLEHLTIDDRLTIANMTTEWGALAGVFPVDDVTLSYYESRLLAVGPSHPRINRERIDALLRHLVAETSNPITPTHYAKHITVDLSTVTPRISGPNSVKVASSLRELEDKDIAIHKAYLVSCVNSRLSDLKAAADVVRASGGKVKEGVEFYVAAASSEVQAMAEKTGDWKVLMDAGAKPLPAGCGPCIGLGVGLLKDNEVGISATNRNFKGRMGSRLAQAFLSSPSVVAASAILGKIASPETLLTPSAPRTPYPELKYTVDIMPKTVDDTPAAAAATVEGFPAQHVGELVFCDTDNLDTDGIYAGMYTYQDDMTPSQMAEVVMKNYDPSFASKVKQGDILVAGFNFGTGSSREQAATSLKYSGVKLIIAGSLSETFKRNAINNGLLCLECPDLVHDLRKAFEKKDPSVWTGWKCEIDFVGGRVKVLEGTGAKDVYRIPTVGAAAQELIVVGGLEAWVKQRL